MDRLRIKAMECKYKVIDRRLKEKFINGINDQTITADIIVALIIIKDMNEITIE